MSALSLGGLLPSLGLGFAGQLLGQEFASDEASSARDFQMNMASTSYQRAVNDMKAAGLNPMLAYQQGGAHMQSAAQARSPQSGYDPMAAQSAAQINRLNAETEKLRAETVTEKSRPANVEADTILKKYQWDLTSEHALTEVKKRDLNEAQTGLVMEEISNAIRQGRKINAETRDAAANAVLRELAAAQATNEAKAQEKFQWYFQNVHPFVGDLGRGASSAAAARQAVKPGGRISINPTTVVPGQARPQPIKPQDLFRK